MKGSDKPVFATEPRLTALRKLISGKKIRRALLEGLAGSSPAMLLGGLRRGFLPYVIVADDADSAGYIFHDLSRIVAEDEVTFLPSAFKRALKYGRLDPPSEVMRTEAIEAFRNSSRLRFLVTYPEALAEKVPQRDVMADNTVTVSLKSKLEQKELVGRLRELGFAETDYVYEPGQFARRGSIVDVYSFNNELPYRIDFFDDDIDSIRTFDVETQLSERKLDGISIVAARSEMSVEGVGFPEFAGPDTVYFVQDRGWLLSQIKGVTEEEFSTSALIAEEGDPEAMKRAVDYESFVRMLDESKIIEFKSSTGNRREGYDAVISYETSPQALYHKNFDMIADSFTSFIEKGFRIMLMTDTPYQADRLKDIFKERGDDITFEPVGFTIHEGFTDNERKICWFTDHQIFDRYHKYNLKADRARSGKLALSLKELNQIEPGDYIVHVDHGIGKFAGLIKSDINGRPQEMIKLLYQNDDIILVSIHALHKLSKYRGKDGIPPKVNKLGTGAWNRLKERTKSKLKDIARDLIKLYAARREEQGFPFSEDGYMQHELEAGFIYEDTPDQLKATIDIKKDMESPQPMDRLVCGDVGFGKTELAIRAAFKAATDGKQTAVLVPTTVLAMQHFRTFSERLKDFPVRVEILSRARKPKEVKQILQDLEEGKIDIIIGTHKLIGKGVVFKDLGLLVVDEEQKFGVAVKEKLKQLKVNVDTLTMSATPIPRTLQFSLMGARDLSSLTTPPANRQPIVTNVTGEDDDVIREAVNFELSRNGQIFYISNRIENLTRIAEMLRRLVPGIRVVTAHGQMPVDQLEKNILDFAAHDYDVLLSTTIVENGIDMPNVNTIMIDNAQNFGLSELHQLRGRVGRSSRKAFCYLIVPPGRPLTPVARRRLQAIESFSDLGSGIHIAMQDLDIRGAGNLLGAEQSGFIADLGYETYQKILKESVLELKTEEFADTFNDENPQGKEEEFAADCTIESDLELRLPPSYVPQESERISLYQQLDNMERPEQTDLFVEHLKDRFGALPKVTEELIKVVPLRLLARRLGIERLILKGGEMYLYFVGDNNKAYYRSNAFGKMLQYLQLNPKRTKIRQNGERRSFLISKVGSVSEALGIMKLIMDLPSI